MNAYQVIHIKYALDKKTMKPFFGKSFFVEQQGFDHHYSAPIRFFKDLNAVKSFLKEQQKSIIKWNRKKTVKTNELTDIQLKVEFEPKGNGYPCEMYKAIQIDIPDEFVNSLTFSKSGW